MGKPKAPAPPDPIETARGQTGTNVATAIANANLNNVNQITPDGSLTFDKTGQFDFKDPVTKSKFKIPQFTATQTLSPQQQAIKEQTDAAELNLGGIANDQSERIRNVLNEPFKIDTEETERRLFDLGSRRLDPLFQEREDQLRTRLANQGIQAGSQAFDREFSNFSEGRNDAFNQLVLEGRGQALQEQLTERNKPFDEIASLLGQTQLEQPNFINPRDNTIPTTDFAGITQNDFNNRLQAHNINSARSGGVISSLGGLFGGLAGLSDRRTKKNIEKVGKIGDQNLYKFNYKFEKDGEQRHIGLMAQEVEKKKPEAVRELFGVKVVDYDKAIGA